MSECGNNRIVSWEEAPGAVLRLLEERAGGRGVVGVSGAVGSGKSSLAGRLGGTVLRTDDYLPEYDDVAEQERDEPGSADLSALVEHLALLRGGLPAEVPVWCFHRHRRVGTRRVEPGGVIVCEGIHALHARVCPWLDVAVLVEAPAGVRWARWEELESRGERGWGVERARAYFDAVAEPTFARFATEYRAAADLIVLNPGGRTLGS